MFPFSLILERDRCKYSTVQSGEESRRLLSNGAPCGKSTVARLTHGTWFCRPQVRGERTKDAPPTCILQHRPGAASSAPAIFLPQSAFASAGSFMARLARTNSGNCRILRGRMCKEEGIQGDRKGWMASHRRIAGAAIGCPRSLCPRH